MFPIHEKRTPLADGKPRAPKILIFGYLIIWMLGIASFYNLL